MRFVLPALAALSVAAISAPARAERTTRYDLGISYVIPDGYHDGTAEKLTTANLLIRENVGKVIETVSENAQGYTNLSLISGILLFVTNSDGKTNDFGKKEAEGLLRGLNAIYSRAGVNFDYQNSAKIRVDNRDALAILSNITIANLNEPVTARLIFVANEGKQYTFIYGAPNLEFDSKVVAFEKFMKTFKFLVRPGTEKPAPKPKPAPTPKPKRKK